MATDSTTESGAPILGTGAHRYECLHDWLTPPSHIAWGDTQGVAQDAQGRIYISHTVGEGSASDDAIVVFERDGTFAGSWGARFKGGGHGLEIRDEGGTQYAYHCDTAHRQVVKTDLSGNVVWEKGKPVESGVYGDDDPFIPTNVALSPNGDFYVTDGYGSDYILRYDIDGNLIQTFGGKGTEPGKVLNAHGIWVDARDGDPKVVVADRANNRLQIFTLDGQHVGFVHDGIRLPCHFDIQGDLLLIPDLKSVVTLLDAGNALVAHLGDGADLPELRGRPKDEFVPGKFIHPHGAKFLENGDILVAEWVPQGRVTLLRKL